MYNFIFTPQDQSTYVKIKYTKCEATLTLARVSFCFVQAHLTTRSLPSYLRNKKNKRCILCTSDTVESLGKCVTIKTGRTTRLMLETNLCVVSEETLYWFILITK